jgi:hypothetical protein
MQQSYYELMYICKTYISTQNLKYFIPLMSLGDAERPYLAVARMEDRQRGKLVPVAEESLPPFLMT